MDRNAKYSIAELSLSFFGACIAGLLYWAHKADVELPCTTGNACDLVWASHWSHLFGIPLSLIGFVGYSGIAILSVAKLNSEARILPGIRFLMLCAATVGTGFSWYLQYVSHVFIGVICPYCMTSAITMTVIFCVVMSEVVGDPRKRTSAASAS